MSESILLLAISVIGSTFAGAGWAGWLICEKIKNTNPSEETTTYSNRTSKISITMILFGSIINCIGLYALLGFTDYLA